MKLWKLFVTPLKYILFVYANDFDEAIQKARKINPEIVGGQPI